MARIQHFTQTHRRALMKTGSYYLLHVVVAASVAYAVTGQLWAALTLSLLEPTVQAVAYFFHERAWARREVSPAALPGEAQAMAAALR